MQNYQRNVSLRDIAKACDVDVSTVSRALRNAKGVSASVRERIQECATKMGYTPNPMVTTLMTQLGAKRLSERTRPTIAVLYKDGKSTQINRQALHTPGLVERAHSQGFNVTHFYGKDPGMTDARLSQIMVAQGIRGLIISRMTPCSLDFDWQHFSVVAHGYSLLSPHVSRISSDHQTNILFALEEARKCGYQRPGLCVPDAILYSTRGAWHAGFAYFRDSLPQRHHVPVLSIPSSNMQAPFKKWFQRYRPDVLLYAGNFDLRELIGSLGLSSPKDLGIIHLDQSYAVEANVFSGIDQQWENIGAGLIDALAAQINRNDYGIPKIPKTILIPGKWVDGETLRKQ